MTDPFSPEADPMKHEVDLRMPRRPLLALVAIAPAALAMQGCARVAPACPTQPAEDGEHAHCRHRFCRYYSG